jgi:hypothetical protein
MKRVHIVLKHARFPHSFDVRYTKYATIESVFDNKAEALAMAKHKDKDKSGQYSVVTKLVLSEFASSLVDTAIGKYYQCDVCGSKCFYEAGMNWEQSTRRNPIPEEHLVRGLSAKLDFCGDMKAICVDCAKTHVCQVVEI